MLTKTKLASWLSNLSLKKVVSNVSGWMQEVHITKQIFPSNVVAFRTANSKKSHYCRNTGETMPPGWCQNSSVGPRSEPCQPMVRTRKSKFGKTMRSFRTNRYANREWLEYSAQRNACYCLLLMTEIKYLLTQDVRTGNRQGRTQEFFRGGLKFWEKYCALTTVQAALFTITFMSYMLFQF